MKKLVEKDFIDQIHDNKMWAINFNFDGRQFLIKDYLELDIDYVMNVDSSIGDGIVFHICPAKIIFECVSSFNIQLSSDTESEGYFNADCLYILEINKKFIKNSKSHYSIIFCNNVGYIEFYAAKASLYISDEKVYKVGDSDSIPIEKRIK
ncbi:hypothetical protein [Pseudocitrobacter corydidari]|uniref:Uncharacterized protein n=1 Tax=Pseudocitrobacter corydidari TaxID=2891570 RepID=A0ABY3S9V8_9ENTR|nr:hypothetical protein [Pseudocitrobacter corydidari]UGS42593.1 hypothetical protein G163CM_33340 [Pseudocitrobacter corydidari]